MKAKKENKLGSTTDGEGNDLNGKKNKDHLTLLKQNNSFLGSDTSLTEDMIRDDLSEGAKSPDCSSSTLIGQYTSSSFLIA